MTPFIRGPKGHPKPFIHTLYVFLHGLICLVDVGKLGFLGYMLDLGDDHRYLYGNWLLEREVRARYPAGYPVRMQLAGVQPGHAKLDEGLNFIVKLAAHPSPSNAPMKAILTLPRPRKIHYFNQGAVREAACNGETSRFIKFPTIVSGLRVFEYRFDDYREVGLVNEHGRCLWECPKPAVVGDRSFATMHVYDEPQEALAGDHNLKEFNMSLQFLGVGNVELKDSCSEPQINDLILPGVLPGETSTLDARDEDVLRMLFQVRRHKLYDATETGGGGGSPVCGGVNGTM